ncbi:16S rRNA (adenine(1518)-N(6)/adenine(1519)-N(6))-dimethyltransferase RsmA [Mycoplasmatota bacterium]|nr:16S rRNA (adenine(1518)-N(6)/adenine(1519)-N(6))-dimethyltransferase RsmA [Mycoplasmatota bacterium]
MNLGKYNSTRKILDEYRLNAKKKFGQNFLIDQNILKKIVVGAKIDKNTIVVEIGPGLGSLTEHLCKSAKEVIAYEIDPDMVRVLNETLSEHDNLTIVNSDFLKDDLSLLENKEIVVVANLPYYITTPILFKMLESQLDIKRFVLMMQKEVANRLSGNINTKEYNALSIAIQYRLEPEILFNVSREVFLPKPNVDSSVILLERLEKKRVDVSDEEWFFKIVKSSFTQRRKTLANNLSFTLGVSKQVVGKALLKLGKREDSRAESLSIEDFAELSEELKKGE